MSKYEIKKVVIEMRKGGEIKQTQSQGERMKGVAMQAFLFSKQQPWRNG